MKRARWCIAMALIVLLETPSLEAMEFMLPKEKKESPTLEERAKSAEAKIIQQSKPADNFKRKKGDYYSLSPSDIQKIREDVKAWPGWEERRITKALDKLETKLPNQSEQNCSQGVRDAIMAERGIDIFKGSSGLEVRTINDKEAATIYGMDRMLKRNGYQIISTGDDYNPERGDVQSICYGQEVNGYGGHVQYYDGKRWISDHKQRISATDPEALKAQGINPSDVKTATYRRKKQY